jgi:hypothetical protein
MANSILPDGVELEQHLANCAWCRSPASRNHEYRTEKLDRPENLPKASRTLLEPV